MVRIVAETVVRERMRRLSSVYEGAQEIVRVHEKKKKFVERDEG